MKLTIIGSNSKGNCYILQNAEEALIIEAGCHIDKIKQALGFNIRKVAGCILTHEHGDHADFAGHVIKAAINLHASHGTLKALNLSGYRCKVMTSQKEEKIGNFRVIPFDSRHDAAQPLGFIINHKETGNILFLTDSIYSPYTFEGLHNIIVEANYSFDIIRQKTSELLLDKALASRIIKSHMSFENTLQLLKANDLSKVNNIVLIHLSDGNSDEDLFRRETIKATGKNVTVATAGMEIEFNRTPF